jgi:hypothetical protein
MQWAARLFSKLGSSLPLHTPDFGRVAISASNQQGNEDYRKLSEEIKQCAKHNHSKAGKASNDIRVQSI